MKCSAMQLTTSIRFHSEQMKSVNCYLISAVVNKIV